MTVSRASGVSHPGGHHRGSLCRASGRRGWSARFLRCQWSDNSRRPALQRLRSWIGDTDALLLGSLAFTRGVKAVLAARGLAIQPFSRQAVADLNGEQNAQVRDQLRQFLPVI